MQYNKVQFTIPSFEKIVYAKINFGRNHSYSQSTVVLVFHSNLFIKIIGFGYNCIKNMIKNRRVQTPCACRSRE